MAGTALRRTLSQSPTITPPAGSTLPEPAPPLAAIVSAAFAAGGGSRETGPDLALLDRMPIGLAIHDAQGELVHSNPHFDRLVSCRQLPSQTGDALRWQGWTAEGEELRAAAYPCRRALGGETVIPGVDLLHFGSDGEGRWLNVSAAPITDPARPGILGVVLLYVGANKPARAMSFAARAGRRFRQFAENSSTAIWIADVGSEAFTYRNPLHLGLLGGADGASLRLADWLGHIDEQDRATVGQRYADVFGGSAEQFEYWLRPSPGHRGRRLRETCFPIRDEAGAIVMIGGMSSDVTPVSSSALYVVGEKAQLSSTVQRLLATAGRKTKSFVSLGALLDVAPFLAVGCVVVDIGATADAETNLPRALAEHASNLPIIIVGRPETHAATAVAAMRAGAADYVIPPVADDALSEALARCAGRCGEAVAAVPPEPSQSAMRLGRLSKREREVLDGLKQGGTNKSIGRVLGISPRTVELHRAHLMERMNARNLAELLHAAHEPNR